MNFKQRSKQRSKKKIKKTQKRGDAYQYAVAEVARSLYPSAIVEVGVWINGPDGRRDLDVVVRPDMNDAPLIVFECKDWNKPIGIGFIDALDSKRRDIGASVFMICSNSGFTKDALRKAARVGIPTLTALIKGDERVRVVVRKQIYTRIVEFIHHSVLIHHQQLSENEAQILSDPRYTKEWTYKGKSLESWVTLKLMNIAGLATKSSSFLARFRFQDAIQLDIRNTQVKVSGIDIRAAFTVQWMTQVAEINASQGMYDYLREVILMGPGPYQYHQTIDSETWGEPVSIEEVPPQLLIPINQRSYPTIPFSEMTFALIKNTPTSDPKDSPDLDEFIESEEFIDEQ